MIRKSTRILSLIVLCIGMTVLFACKGEEKTEAPAASTGALDGDTSYAFGMLLSLQFKDLGLVFDYNAFMQGFRESLEGKEPKFSVNDAIAKADAAYMAALASQSETLKEEETAYLATNMKKEGIVVTASGLQYEVITEGTGETPVGTDTVKVHYEGSLIDGTIFDSSYTRGEPTEFSLGGVIPGWSEGIQLMREGSVYRFYIPSELAYGEQGAGGSIPPYSTLIFKVELLSIIQ
jgi:FKBP-type peptidyl-prolyl cis-trans isomerase